MGTPPWEGGEFCERVTGLLFLAIKGCFLDILISIIQNPRKLPAQIIHFRRDRNPGEGANSSRRLPAATS